MNEKALDQFIEKTEKIEKMIKKIKEHIVENHLETDPEEVNWCHVGTANYVIEQLAEIIESLRIRDNPRITAEQVVERWNRFASEKYKVGFTSVLALSAEYNDKYENNLPFEIPAMMSADNKPHIIG